MGGAGKLKKREWVVTIPLLPGFGMGGGHRSEA